MKFLCAVCLFASLAGAAPARAAGDAVAPGGTLRAVYLATNPVQAVKDPTTGEIRGISVNLARELGRRLALPVTLSGLGGIQPVIEAVRTGAADMGFLAKDPSRRGPVVFSQTYLRNPQSFVVPEASPIRSARDIDRPGLRIGVTEGDSIALYLGRSLKQAQLVETKDPTAAAARRLFTSGAIDAYGASRLRLMQIAAQTPQSRILPDNLYGVPQAIIVPIDRPEALAAVNRFIDAVRQDGFLQAAIDRSGTGVEIEPAGAPE
jgi:polar amino acid transport system substrate-binding protein